MFFSERGTPNASDGIEHEGETESRKRPRLMSFSSDVATGEEIMTSVDVGASRGLFTPTPSDVRTEQDVYIKTEDEAQTFQDLNVLPRTDLVTIYVGAASHEHRIPQADLAKSRVLKEWLKTDSDEPYVMHPALKAVDNRHFASLIRFMHKGEYLPKVIDIAIGSMSSHGTALTRKGLNTLMTAEQYSNQLVRAGHLYKLAEKFEVKPFEQYIYSRITETEFYPYSNNSVLDLAGIIFSRPNALRPDFLVDTNDLELWILTKIAWQFQPIMNLDADRVKFFKTVAKTNKSQFCQRLFRRKADLVDEAGGEPDHLE